MLKNGENDSGPGSAMHADIPSQLVYPLKGGCRVGLQAHSMLMKENFELKISQLQV